MLHLNQNTNVGPLDGARVQLPYAPYTVRCTEASCSVSKKGDPYIKLDCEIMNYNGEGTIQVMMPGGAQQVNISGVYCSCIMMLNEQGGEETLKAMNRLGIDVSQGVDPAAPPFQQFIGKEFIANITSKKKGKINQIDQTPILDGDGKPMFTIENGLWPSDIVKLAQ